MMFCARISLVAASLGIAAVASPAVAQWINHPTPGIPRTKDGKPNLTAPAPRTADGKPDLSGLWQMNGLGYATNITDTEMLPWAQKVYQQRIATYGHDDPAVGCLPEGPRTSLAGLDPIRIIHTPAIVFIVYESGPVRQIFTDGRTLPTDPTPTWMGYSIGRWEGDTLVVQTAGFNDKTWLDFRGHPHSEALRVTERFRRTDFGTIQLAVTYDDPKTYTKPFTINVPVRFVPDTDLLENVCLENEKDRARLVGRPPDEQKAGHKVPRDLLARYAGVYEFGPLGAWTVSVDGDDLKIELSTGGGKQALIPISDSVFSFPGSGGTVKFVDDGKGTITTMVLTIVEGDMPGKRR